MRGNKIMKKGKNVKDRESRKPDAHGERKRETEEVSLPVKNREKFKLCCLPLNYPIIFLFLVEIAIQILIMQVVCGMNSIT